MQTTEEQVNVTRDTHGNVLYVTIFKSQGSVQIFSTSPAGREELLKLFNNKDEVKV